MSVRDTVRQQYSRIVDRSSQQLSGLDLPAEGWISLLRKALGMSGADVAKRMGVSRNAVYQAERNERDGAITIKQMEKLAEAMGGRFVYTIMLDDGVAGALRKQARSKAEARIRRTSAHMALEAQSLAEEQTKQKIDELADQLVRDMPPDFWEAR